VEENQPQLQGAPRPPSQQQQLSTTSSSSRSCASNGNKKKKTEAKKGADVRKQWRCDICKVRSFATFEDACRHEEQCKKVRQGHHQRPEKIPPNSINDADDVVPPRKNDEGSSAVPASIEANNSTVRKGGGDVAAKPHPFFVQKKRLAVSANATSTKPDNTTRDSKGSDNKKKARVASEPSVVCNQSHLDGKSASAPYGSNSVKDAIVIDSACSSSAQPPLRRSARTKRTIVKLSDNEDDEVWLVASKKGSKMKDSSKTGEADKETTASKNGRKKLKKRSGVGDGTGTAVGRKKNGTLAPVFQWAGTKSDADRKTFLAEQATAEFRAQRLQREREAKERKLRREQQQKQLSAVTGTKSAVSAKPSRVQSSKSMAPRFPVPSHVIPAEHEKEVIRGIEKSCLSEDEHVTVHPLPVKARQPSDSATVSPDNSVYPHLLPPEEYRIFDGLNDENTNDYCVVKQLLARTIAVDTNKDIPLPDPYGDDPTTARLLESDAAQEVTDFCQKWMVERHKANRRMAERQQIRAGKNRSKKNHLSPRVSRRRCDEDDLWEDSDDGGGGSNVSNFLDSLCLLTGPVGSGKSSLVRAVARDCGCSVLEINTTQKRGASALKKAVEEATLSHSSIQLLSNTQNSQEDSDDEDQEHAKVTVILIDEVDNLFLQNGDNGFWTALIEVTKKSKCPIFLTSNIVPSDIDLRRLTHIHVMRPTPSECVPIIRDMLEAKGLVLVNEDEDSASAVDNNLTFFADLCHCDVRRMAHTLHAHAYEATTLTAVSGSFDYRVKVNFPEEDTSVALAPCIADVTPRSVHRNEYALLTIKGKGFSELISLQADDSTSNADGHPVAVWIGGDCCPQARIMNDITILAVKKPCQEQLFRSCDKTMGDYHQRRCLTAEYKPVSVYSLSLSGPTLAILNGAVKIERLSDGNKILTASTPVLVECRHSPVSTDGETIESNVGNDEEMEYEDNTATSGPSSVPRILPPDLQPVDSAEVDKVLKEGIASWRRDASVSSPESVDLRVVERGSVTNELEWTSPYIIASDAAVLHDYGSNGLPYLAGTCRGFGFDLTEVYPFSTNEKSKP